ncbi:MAG TPA: hypothetical protein VKP30_12710 [Polyangiaceae bacterium]|nr:hypothetical protein [Polyangiaceae bacterium]
METILKGLRDLEGVNGAFLADSSGQIYAYNAESIYDAKLLGQVSKSIATAIDSVKLLQDDWDTITAQFSDGRLVLRSVRAGTRKGAAPLTLALIADSRLNPSFATVAIRVALGRIKTLADENGLAPLAATSGAAPARNASAAFESNASAPAMKQSHSTATPEVATSGLSWSGFGGSSSIAGSGVSVADAASSAVLSACTKCLAKAVGPMAKVFVKEAVRKVAPGQPFAQAMLPELVLELEKNIEDRDDAREFRKAVTKIA